MPPHYSRCAQAVVTGCINTRTTWQNRKKNASAAPRLSPPMRAAQCPAQDGVSPGPRWGALGRDTASACIRIPSGHSRPDSSVSPSRVLPQSPRRPAGRVSVGLILSSTGASPITCKHLRSAIGPAAGAAAPAAGSYGPHRDQIMPGSGGPRRECGFTSRALMPRTRTHIPMTCSSAFRSPARRSRTVCFRARTSFNPILVRMHTRGSAPSHTQIIRRHDGTYSGKNRHWRQRRFERRPVLDAKHR